MKRTRKRKEPIYHGVPAHMQAPPAIGVIIKSHHSKEALEAEIVAFTAGPNIPAFLPDFAISLATTITRKGTLSGPQAMRYLEVHEQLVAQGYMTCPDCQHIEPKDNANLNSSDSS